MRITKSQAELDFAKDIKTHSRRFFSHVNKKSKSGKYK